MMRVLGRKTSINVRKVLWAAGELGLAYQHEDWGMPLRDPKVPEFLALNPNGVVPVLIEDGFVLWESIAIMVYLNHGAGGKLLLGDARAQAHAMQWVLWQNNEMGSNWVYPLMSIIRKAPGFDDPQKLADNIAAWAQKMDIIEAHLAKGGEFVAGDAFSLADISITLGLHRWFAIPFDHKPMPASQAYYERMKARPAAAEWLTDAMP